MTLILAVVKKVTVFWKHQTEVCLAIGLLETNSRVSFNAFKKGGQIKKSL